MSDLNIAEGISGTWFYHLRKGDDTRALCGANVMHTSIPMSQWGMKMEVGRGIMSARWCQKCHDLLPASMARSAQG